MIKDWGEDIWAKLSGSLMENFRKSLPPRVNVYKRKGVLILGGVSRSLNKKSISRDRGKGERKGTWPNQLQYKGGLDLRLIRECIAHVEREKKTDQKGKS